METARARSEIGALIRDWRRRRRLSQLGLALEAEVSPRHLSFIESGRAAPSRGMVLRLAERLAVPLRERNLLLAAAGFAPVFPERRVDAPELAAAMAAVERLLDAHAPCPALAIDARWNVLRANAAARALMADAAPALLAPPVNVLRLSLHPEGLGPRIVNHAAWRAHVLDRLSRQVADSGDAALEDLRRELAGYPRPTGARRPPASPDFDGVATPLQVEADGRVLSFLSATTVFGTALDVTLAGVVVESFFPADAATAAALREGALAPPPLPSG